MGAVGWWLWKGHGAACQELSGLPYPAGWGDFPSLGDILPMVGHRTGAWSGLVPTAHGMG